MDETVSGGYVGAVGQIIAAVLQTVGLYAQSEVLVSVAPTLEKLATLCYTVSLFGGVISVALFGNYRQALYFFIGPALFAFVLSNKVSAEATILRYGDRIVENSTEDQKKLLNEIAGEGLEDIFGSVPQVSWLFAKYDSVVSTIVQSVVALLLNNENKEDMLQAAKERVFSRVFLAKGVNKEFLQLVSMGTMGHCGQVNALVSEVANKEKLLNDLPAGSPDYADIASQVETMRAEYIVKYSEKVVKFKPELQTYIVALDPNYASSEMVLSCEDIWNLVIIDANKQAEDWLEKQIQEQSVELGIPAVDVRQKITEAIYYNNPARAADVIAIYLIKNTQRQTAHEDLVGTVVERAPFRAHEATIVFDEVAAMNSRGGFLKIGYFAGAVPYVQGLLLFILAFAFPFFAVFLVMPGRILSFFNWMMLWLWVKSWDVGFAVVDLVREFMFKFVSQSIGVGGGDGVDIFDPSNAEAVYSIINQNDPLATYNTFTTIVGLLITSVPLLTAHLCLGATDLYGAFKNSINGTADRFAQNKANASRRDIADKRDAELEAFKHDAAMRAVNAEASRLGHSAFSFKSSRDLSTALATDATLPRSLDGAYKQGMWNAHFSKEGNMRRAEIAALTGRRSSYSTGMAANLIDTELNKMKQDYVGNPVWQDNYIPGLAGKKGTDSNTTISNVSRRGGQQSVDDISGDPGGDSGD